MNTALAYNQKSIRKIVNNSLYFTVLLSLFCSQSLLVNNNLFANEAIINNGANITQDKVEEQTRSLTEEKQRWESMLRQRYRNGAILTLADGVKHIRMVKYINSRPVKINIVEVNTKINPNIEIAPQLASTNLKHRATIRTIASRNNSIAAVNGTYFKPQNGVPLGTLMIDKKVYTGPIHNRVAMGIGKNEFKMAQVQFNSTLKAGRQSLKIDNINQPRMLSTYTLLYTRDWGLTSPTPPKYGVNIAIQNNKITAISYGSTAIPENGYVISGPKAKLEPFFMAKKIELDIKMVPQWENIDHIISGGPYLIKDGEVFIDVTAQKLGAITGKNPRTAIGYTAHNEFIMVTVDGREHASVGMTLGELARMMKGFGCINAMNLDGGGSTVMYVQGKVVNNPAQKGGIPISNALTISERTRIAYDENNS
ncbi:n-acetylglucosamine-1-phosphodiester alpha-N-acetylglucosaminidase-like exopolysaccharide biosynthesis protein [Clostridium sp. CAG:306]|jgi:possible exopolysaccharide biosynthesis protein|nr:n-acetylglucosamine-1-phosphodiester alpha-N-acetylglucosaminidase-like exopolysaccharide biosynthesis protein [Clostridium sp. CAG:306]